MTISSTSPATAWEAPLARSPLDTTVEIPGSKSLTNRLLVLAALAEGPGTLYGALRSRDTDLMIQALRALGANIKAGDTPSTLHITPRAITGNTTIDTGLAGTVMRFLPPIAALAQGSVHFDGDPVARVRPMLPILAGLRALDVTVHDPAHPGHPPTHLPFTVEGQGGLQGGAVDIDASASSQFVSGLLLAAPRFEHGLTLRHIGATLPSLPHIDMTVATLRKVGVIIDDSRDGIWDVSPGPIASRDVRVEPDLSNAAPFLAAALIAGGTVRIPGWPASSTQPGASVPELLERMGGTSTVTNGVLAVTGTGEVHGVDVDLHACGELAPTFAVLAALANSPSRLRGIAHLRGHETDRLAALAREITRLGGQAEETRDGLVITPRPLHGDVVRTYADHRIATSAALLGLRVPGVHVEDVETTAKTLPDFTTMWLNMLGSEA